MMKRSRTILIGFVIVTFVFFTTFFGLFTSNNNNNNLSSSSSSSPTIASTKLPSSKKPNSFDEFVKKNQNSAKSVGKISCQSMADEKFNLPFGGAEGLLSLLRFRQNNKNSSNNNDDVKKDVFSTLRKQKQKHEQSILNVVKTSIESMSQCRPSNSEFFHSAADAFTIKSPGAFCPSSTKNRNYSSPLDAVGTKPVDGKLEILAKTNAGDEFVESLTLGPKEGKSIIQAKLTSIISNGKKLKKDNNNNDSSNNNNNNNNIVGQKFICPDSWLKAGATILECDSYYNQNEHLRSRATSLDELFESLEVEDIKLSVQKSLELVKVVNDFLGAVEGHGGWWSEKQSQSQRQLRQQQSTIDDSPEPEGETNNGENNSTSPSDADDDENTKGNSNKKSPPPVASSNSKSISPSSALTTTSDPDRCLLENLSGAFLAQVRKNILEERTDYELSLFSDASLTIHFEKSAAPMINLPFFSNGRKFPANDRLQYAQEYSDMTLKTGGFPTFEFSGPQPGLFVSIFTKAVVGYSYVFTCATGRAYGNGGAKESRFEFAGTESLAKVGSSSKKAAKKLPCRPLASAFGPRSGLPVRVAVPLCTSRYCRWYGIYHFMLEHLPQMTTVLDVLTQVPGAFLVVTENPSLTIRSLLVDALGIPKNRIIIGPVKADLALLPTPGLVYRPLSHALRYFRRVILSRMGLEWRASVIGEKMANSKIGNVTAVSSSTVSLLNPFFDGSSNDNNKSTTKTFRSFERRFCSSSSSSSATKIPEIRILFSERGAIKATTEQKQVRLPLNWQDIKLVLRNAFPCVRFQTEKEVREDVRDTIFSFYEADIVLGVHGANLLFTQFMRRGTHLIEMISADASLNPRCFYNLASEVGVKYSALMHDGGHKLKEYYYELDPLMVVQRVNASMNEILENLAY